MYNIPKNIELPRSNKPPLLPLPKQQLSKPLPKPPLPKPPLPKPLLPNPPLPKPPPPPPKQQLSKPPPKQQLSKPPPLPKLPYPVLFQIKRIDTKKHTFLTPVGLKVASDFINCLEYDNKLQFSIKQFYKKSGIDDRLHVIICCNNLITKTIETLNYYTSNSDGSFWRFCIQIAGQYDKGYNYISTTFINIYLQRFIFECMELFNILIDDNIYCLITPDVWEIDYLHKRIYTDTYVCKNPFFYIMNLVFPPPEYIMNYKDCLIRLINFISEYTIRNNSDEKTVLKICSDIFCSLQKEKLSTDISLSGEKSRRTFFTKINTVFSNLFLEYYELIEETKKKVFDKKFKVGELDFDASIYSIEFQSKKNMLENLEEYVLYYMIYNNELIGKNKTFIHIIPKNTEGITQYGLDNEYVVAGPMTYKVFDYRHQAILTPIIDMDILTPQYRFTGELINYGFLPD